MAQEVITHDEKVDGWVSFHSYTPDMMVGMNNRFFSFKGGNLYVHHSEEVPRNNFYGVQYPTQISTMVNARPSEIKEMKQLSIEGSAAWDVLIESYVSSLENPISSSVDAVEFVKKEGVWMTYTRRNEDATHYDSKSTYGIGRVTDVTGLAITINGGNSSLAVGDVIVKGSDLSIIGIIQTITGNVLTLDSVGTLAVTDFIVGMKDPRVEGGGLRGYTFRLDLESDVTTKLELFAVNAEVIRSYS